MAFNLPSESGIYQIVNNVTQKRYVGCASCVRTRINGHISDLEKNKHRNQYLQRAWNKYGRNNFSISLIQICSKDDLFLFEDYWVRVLKVLDREFGYNIMETNPYGSPQHSEETKEKLRVAHKGKKPSESCRMAVIEYWKTHKMTAEHNKARLEGLKKIDWKVLRQDKAKKVLDIDNNIVYNSFIECATLTGLSKSTLYRRLTNKTKTERKDKRTNANHYIYLN